jgi:hypothetical protein
LTAGNNGAASGDSCGYRFCLSLRRERRYGFLASAHSFPGSVYLESGLYLGFASTLELDVQSVAHG